MPTRTQISAIGSCAVQSREASSSLLQGDLALRVRELIRQTCEKFEIQIIRGVVSKDHINIYLDDRPFTLLIISDGEIFGGADTKLCI